MAAMIESIGQILGGPHLEAITKSGQEAEANPAVVGVRSGQAGEQAPHLPPIFQGNNAWEDFQKTLDSLTIPARDLIRELDPWFQRKTFNEPLHCCEDQAWLRRYDGAIQTRDRLMGQIDRVRAACCEHESSLFEMLVSEVDAYAMALAALLLMPKTFPLGDGGELKMDSGIRTSCEDRRLAIKSLAGRLVNPVDRPLKGRDAVRFMGAETNEERKMIIHRLESAIRSKWEEVYQETNKGPDADPRWQAAIGMLTSNRKPIDFRASSWDLDRIFYYLLIDYFRAASLKWIPPQDTTGSVPVTSASLPVLPTSKTPDSGGNNWRPMPQDIMCAARDIEIEVERYRAKSKGGSITPLTYALVALQTLGADTPDLHDRNFDNAQAAVRSAIDLVKHELADVLGCDAGRALSRLMNEIALTAGQSTEQPMRDPSRSSAPAT
jgi:hypothetical protein